MMLHVLQHFQKFVQARGLLIIVARLRIERSALDSKLRTDEPLRLSVDLTFLILPYREKEIGFFDVHSVVSI